MRGSKYFPPPPHVLSLYAPPGHLPPLNMEFDIFVCVNNPMKARLDGLSLSILYYRYR